jgi:FtsP/CotA-like multicopper oxidase with cupredoxin domain
MKLLATQVADTGYVCPMHPEVRSDTADRCPQCGMKLVPARLVGSAGHTDHGHGDQHGHTHGDVHSEHGGHGDGHSSGGPHAHFPAGIEWEDDMVEVNRMTTPANMRWKLVDRATGAVGQAIDWTFRVGDRVKIRIVNEMDSDHPMHHPFHIHGAGRFLVVARDGAVEPNLVWKDTVLIPTGQTVDLLLEVTNPGRWMAHCHISEHHEGGMMLGFSVEP